MNMKAITEKTTLSIGLLITILGGASYVTYVAFQTEANAKMIRRIESKQELMEEVRTRLAVIESKLERIEHKLE